MKLNKILKYCLVAYMIFSTNVNMYAITDYINESCKDFSESANSTGKCKFIERF